MKLFPAPWGERICGRTECNESGQRADEANCNHVAFAEFWERGANSREVAVVHERIASVTNVGEGDCPIGEEDYADQTYN